MSADRDKKNDPLQERAFQRADESPDEEFYRDARLVTHIDERAIAAVTQLYREHFPAGGAILDLMSSWISHLPEEISYRRVAGLGLNEEELRNNPRLDDHLVQNLNENTKLPFEDDEFDGCGICVSVDYLVRPVEVLREVGRVLKLGAPLVITFSNRCFPEKVVSAWLELGEAGRVELVESYLRDTGNFREVHGLDRGPRLPLSDPLYAVIGRSAGARG